MLIRSARKIDHNNLSDFANSLGLIYYEAGNYTKALEYLLEALKINKSSYSISIPLDNLGLVHRQLKAFDLALKYHQQALTKLSFAFTDSLVTALPIAQTIRSEPQKEYFL